MEIKSVLNKQLYQAQFGPIKMLPEKVLQFGTGVLLRGLPDYFIDKANKLGVFNGSIVIVKSTSTGTVNEFEEQDALFTHTIKGILDGRQVDDFIVNTSVSRVVSASSQWEEVMTLAKSPELKIVISNTTEAGLVFDASDKINGIPPFSFPGKLLSVLFERWKHFSGNTNTCGLIVLPTELVPDNGMILQKIVFDLAAANNLPTEFMEWLPVANDFCNTLVDRIVPGKLSAAEQLQVEQKLGYKDHLLISSEPFALWAIETNRTQTKELLAFAQTDPSVVIAPSILKFRELKLRLLNGTHTFCCGVALLAGFETVKDAMANADFRKFMERVLKNEIAPCVVNEEITMQEAISFGNSVVDRFCNPTIEHKWTSIASNFSDKMKMRNAPLIEKYIKINGVPANGMSLGFAAFCIYQQAQDTTPFKINTFSSDTKFEQAVLNWVEQINKKGMNAVLAAFVNNKSI